VGRQKDTNQLRKLMAYVLGRRPDEFGVVSDVQGFVRIKDLLQAISEEPGWGFVRKSHIHEVLMCTGETSFVVEHDRIRATCPDKALGYEAGIAPPKRLYHCVRPKAYPVICQRGIIPMGRSHVFLTTTKELALRMGKRRDHTPVLLTVFAQKAFESGITFSRQGDLIYMADYVPIAFFAGPPVPKEKKKTAKAKKESSCTPEPLQGSFLLDLERSRGLQQQRLKRKGLRKEIAWKQHTRNTTPKNKKSG